MASYASKSDITFLISKVKAGLSEKVDTAEGKGLSSNDFTDVLKTKLEAAPTTANVKEQIEAYGYQTSVEVQEAIKSAIGKITEIKFQIVTSLPTTGVNGVIYFVANTHGDSGDNYDEYIWLEQEHAYEKIGNKRIDLSGYMKKTDVTEIGTTELTNMWNG